MIERAARLRLQADEAPMRFTMIGGVIAGAAGALYDREAPLWIMAVAGLAGGFVGWILGYWRRQGLLRRERQILASLDRNHGA